MPDELIGIKGITGELVVKKYSIPVRIYFLRVFFSP